MLGVIIAVSGRSQVPSVILLVADVFSSNSALHEVLVLVLFAALLVKVKKS